MWLLNAQKIKLEHFQDSQRPRYAILSHTWGAEEITFDLMQQAQGSTDKLSMLVGWYKIEYCCRQAIRDGYTHAWIDTCCIDKASSAELSEAINSMYRWYEEAAVCYAFLSDVSETGVFRREAVASAQSANTGRQRRSSKMPSIVHSRWFDRGWTLQELPAPADLHFYGNFWQYLGSKQDQSEAIANRTRIPASALRSFKPHEHPVATRMSWAASRSTTRIEDRAYSLMGIFGVNMPLIYGEGSKSFMRLQEEIMRVSNDMSMFAWTGVPDSSFGMLASDPDCFKDSHNIILQPPFAFDPSNQYELSKAGITGTLHLWHYVLNVFVAGIAKCRRPSHISKSSWMASSGVFCIFLEQKADHTFQRVTMSGNNCAQLELAKLEQTHDYGKRRIQISRVPCKNVRVTRLPNETIESMGLMDDTFAWPELSLIPGVLYRDGGFDEMAPWTRIPSKGAKDLLRVHLPKIKGVHGCVLMGFDPGIILRFHKRPLMDGSYHPAVLSSMLVDSSSRHSGKVSKDHRCCEAGCVELVTRVSNGRGLTTSFKQTTSRILERAMDGRWDDLGTKSANSRSSFKIGDFLKIEFTGDPNVWARYAICNFTPRRKKFGSLKLVLPRKLPKSSWVFDYGVEDLDDQGVGTKTDPGY